MPGIYKAFGENSRTNGEPMANPSTVEDPCFSCSMVLPRASLKVHIPSRLFRHSRATFLANHLKEAQMKEYFGWVRASDMAAVYVHLSGRDVDDALLRLHGIARDEDGLENTPLKPKTCARCELTNPATHRFCKRCGHPLDTAASIELVREQMDRKDADNLLDTMLEDPGFKKLFQERAKQALQAH